MVHDRCTAAFSGFQCQGELLILLIRLFADNRWGLFAVTWIAFFLCVASLAQCTFVVLVPDNSQVSGMVEARGMFSEALYEDGTLRGCLSYTSDSGFKGAFMAARVFGVLTSIILGLSVGLVSGMVLFVTRHQLRRLFLFIMRILLPVAFFCSAFMFSAFSADECKSPGVSCKPGSAGIIGAINTILVFAIAVLAILVPGPKHSIFIPVWLVPAGPTGGHAKRAASESTNRPHQTEVQETALTRAT
jgi:hypothetical protein